VEIDATQRGSGVGHWGDAYYGSVYLESVRDLLTPRLSELEVGVILTLLRLGAADRVLDAGCGHGRHAGRLARTVRSLIGLDRNAAALREASAPLTPTGGGHFAPCRSPPASGPPASPSTEVGGSPPDTPDVGGGEGERIRPTSTPNPASTPHPHPPSNPNPNPAASFVRGDVRALPFTPGAFDAAYSWYASLFMFDDATNLACLAGIARVVRPGGRVLVHHANPLRLALEPHDEARYTLPDGTLVEEESAFDPRSGVDRSARRLVRPDGSVVAATAELRYYSPAEWRDLSRAAGLRVVEITTTPRAGGAPAGELESDAPDLIALLEKPT
jgi:SAM-dependent methyltransferase